MVEALPNATVHRMRHYRKDRLLQMMQELDIPTLLIYDPVSIRYATDSRNVQVYALNEVGHRQRQSLSGCACSNPATTTDSSVVCRSARSNLTLRPPPRMDQDRLTKIRRRGWRKRPSWLQCAHARGDRNGYLEAARYWSVNTSSIAHSLIVTPSKRRSMLLVGRQS